jgi:ferredoxin/flavodoxin---NADP+ reductase
VRLIATGFGEVATAVNNAAAYLNPDVSAFPGHLSDYAPPGATGSPTA